MDTKKLPFEEKLPFIFSSERHIDVECVVHIHATMEIVLVTEGVLQMTVDGKEYDIPKDHGLFIPPFAPHTFRSVKPNLCHVLIFSEVLVPYFFEYVKENAPRSHLFAVSDASMALAESVLPDYRNTADYICAEAVLAPLCRDIYNGCDFEPRNRHSEDTLSTVLSYISAHFTEKLDLESVARATGHHPVTISKIFSRHTGVGFNYYLQYQRCAYAAQLIKTKNMSFAEIAYESGFGSIRSFNRSFSMIYGRTPTEYKSSF